MSTDKPLKSAVELALERLKKQDADAGIVERPLTPEQKAAIVELRKVYETKIAEQDVLLRSKKQQTYDPAEQELYEREFRQERDFLTAERDAKIEKIRRGETP
jgi:hypothetical protein